jgi:hypothetical protein
MRCTAAPRYEAQFPETTSGYAEHGRIAHEFAELKATYGFSSTLTKRQYTAKLNRLKKAEIAFVDAYNAEHPDKPLQICADHYTDIYAEHLTEKAMGYALPPLVKAEARVDLTDYIPEGFGTCDCIMIGDKTLNIVDFKFGVGVPVSAEGNAQMRLYALGALKKYKPFFGDLIKHVCMTIDQPRVQDEPDSETITVEELLAWGETVKPLAEVAFSGFGEYVPGAHCRFCRGKAQCRARAEQSTELECFKDLQLPDGSRKVPPEANILTNAEIADLLARGKALAAWYADIDAYALKAALNGEEMPGYKVVAGISRRQWQDQDAAIEAILAAGYHEATVYKPREPQTLAQLEKHMGKEEFKRLVGRYVIKPLGKPTLVPLSDKREPYNSVEAAFGGLGGASPSTANT